LCSFVLDGWMVVPQLVDELVRVGLSEQLVWRVP
jgi:hypothetical protein